MAPWLLILLVLVLAGCSGHLTTSHGYDGSYQLASIAGQPLPYLIPHDFPTADERIRSGTRIELTGWTFRVTWLREWLDESGAVIPGSQQESVGTGMLSVNGTAVSLAAGDGTVEARGTLSNGVLTLVGTSTFADFLWLTPRTLVFRR